MEWWCVCVCVSVLSLYRCVLRVFFCVSRLRRCRQRGLGSPPGHRMVTWRPWLVLCVSSVFVCLAGHERRADDVRSPWVMFRQSSARSGNHPVYGPYVNVALRRMHSTSVGLARRRTHTRPKPTRPPSTRGSHPGTKVFHWFSVFFSSRRGFRSEKNPTSCSVWPRLDSKT